ncbi:hypothetical protein VPH35_120565 [Triticum aestivum]|uniref:Uncharacterized protein n=1 Tax=Triticum urartu TaxID=4572 RepID=A0A8R7V0W9_TRIUA
MTMKGSINYSRSQKRIRHTVHIYICTWGRQLSPLQIKPDVNQHRFAMGFLVFGKTVETSIGWLARMNDACTVHLHSLTASRQAHISDRRRACARACEGGAPWPPRGGSPWPGTAPPRRRRPWPCPARAPAHARRVTSPSPLLSSRLPWPA